MLSQSNHSQKILYMECLSGISGDMTVASLLDLGADEQKLRNALKGLPIGGYELQISRVKKTGLNACDFHVCLDEAHENHDHDMEYLYGHASGHQPGEAQTHNHQRMHQHEHHEHRAYCDIVRLIHESTLKDRVKEIALRIFEILAEAEAKAHGVPVAEVCFHEVGAVDSIVDIVAVAVCIDELAPNKIIFSALAEGCGTVRCQHGILPVPVPAVTNIVSRHGLILHQTKTAGELVTPTGAAIAAALVDAWKLPENYRIQAVGIGAGKRDYGTAGVVRAMWIEEISGQSDTIVKLECNMDDVTGEQLGYCMEKLFEAGAKDVSYLPVFMKKNRPAYELRVICTPELVPRMEELIFANTTTIGIRKSVMERTLMARATRMISTPVGDAEVKICQYGNIIRPYPEYNSVVELAKKHGKDYWDIYQCVQATAIEMLSKIV
ncbi:MAG: nickel pincer cofactor biosynthesis protein LarC [bacterium]|nr:nickel pincer cofactor biosynthesis protein LarC [bacterium]